MATGLASHGELLVTICSHALKEENVPTQWPFALVIDCLRGVKSPKTTDEESKENGTSRPAIESRILFLSFLRLKVLRPRLLRESTGAAQTARVGVSVPQAIVNE